MISLGFTVSNADEAVFYQIESETKYTIVAVATDDLPSLRTLKTSQTDSNKR